MSANHTDNSPVAIHADPDTGFVTATLDDSLAPADQPTSDFIRKAIVVTSCLLILVAGVALALGMYLPSSGRVTPEGLTSIFLVVFGFLAGLLAQNSARRGA